MSEPQVGIRDNENLHGATLDRAGQQELLATQSECTVIFSGTDGWPSGVVMSFLEVDGTLWLTSVEGRAQTCAVATDPRVSIVVSNAGTRLEGRRMLAIRGTCHLHRDAETKAWFFPRFAAKLAPGGEAKFIQLMDSPKRVIFEVRPIAVPLSHDSRRMAGDGRGGPKPGA
jgi:general stress protein 26